MTSQPVPSVDLEQGLESAEARRRLEERGPNENPPPEPVHLHRRVLRELREPMALLLIAAAAVDGLLLTEWVDAVAITVIVVLNATIAIAQEGRANRALEALREFEVPLTRVRRDGRVVEILARELVDGDLVLLDAGDRVPADVRLVDAYGLEIDEAVLTGESMPVRKEISTEGVDHDSELPVAEQTWKAFSGTMVVRGTARGVVVATGRRTALGSIAAGLERAPSPTPLQRQLARLTATLGIAAVVAAVAVAGLVLIRSFGDRGAVEEAFLAGVALAVAAVPEGLATVTAVGLALGVRRMAHRGAIIRRLPAVETLGSTTVLAFDKTGTVTENRMSVETLTPAFGTAASIEELPRGIAAAAARVGALCSQAALNPPTGDPIEIALLEASDPADVAGWRSEYTRVALIPFDSERKRMTAVHVDRAAHPLLTVKGAPEIVLGRCASALDAQGRPIALDTAERERLLGVVSEMASSGIRTLALAQRPLDEVPALPEDAEDELTFVAMAALRDPVRPGARDSVAALRGAGIRPLMVTGDHPGTAANVADAIGLSTSESTLLTGAELRAGQLPDDPTSVSVYARVDPAQKLDLVDRLQERGEVVAMTGDGVNDAPALQAADIGVALGRTGSDVAREAADMVITDDDLATIGMAVREGRGIYANVRKVVDYLVAGNLSEIVVIVVALLAFPELGVPLLPLQILWVNLLTDGMPALALGVDPVDPDLMSRTPRDPAEPMLGTRRFLRLARRAAVLAAAPLLAFVVSRYVLDAEWVHARSVLFTTLVVTHLLYSLTVRPLPPGRWGGLLANGWLAGTLVASLLLQLVVVAWGPAQQVFDTEALTAVEWFVAAAASLTIAVLVAWVRRLERRADAQARPGDVFRATRSFTRDGS